MKSKNRFVFMLGIALFVSCSNSNKNEQEMSPSPDYSKLFTANIWHLRTLVMNDSKEIFSYSENTESRFKFVFNKDNTMQWINWPDTLNYNWRVVNSPATLKLSNADLALDFGIEKIDADTLILKLGKTKDFTQIYVFSHLKQ